MPITEEFFPTFDRLEPRTPFAGGRISETDLLTLAEAASMASVHAGQSVTIGDFLRAAGRGEIPLHAIVHRSAKTETCRAADPPLNGGRPVPAGAIPTLPMSACQHLANVGRAAWRTFDGFELNDMTLRPFNGPYHRYTRYQLTADEPDFETVPDDCRVTGRNVHALADAFVQEATTSPADTEAPVTAIEGAVSPPGAPVVALPHEPPAKRRTLWDVATPYLVEIIRAGQYGNAKRLFKSLEAKAGPDSPFDKGIGDNRGSLFVREICEPMALKTLQNNWQKLMAEAAKK